METVNTLKTFRTWKKFKSYYVVWKRQKKKEDDIDIQSLNRTMQYGNHKHNILKYLDE